MQNESSSSTPIVDGKLFAIGILSVTACVLFVGFLMLSLTPQPAYAEGMTSSGGDYHLTTFRVADSREMIVVTDAAARQVITYAWDGSRRELALMARYDLSRFDELENERGDRRNRGRNRRR